MTQGTKAYVSGSNPHIDATIEEHIRKMKEEIKAKEG